MPAHTLLGHLDIKRACPALVWNVASPCSSSEMSEAAGASADCTAGLAVSSHEGAARKGLLCFRRAAGGPMLDGAFESGALPREECLGGGGGGMDRSCSFTSDFSA